MELTRKVKNWLWHIFELPTCDFIKVGERIVVDKGILGTDYGVLKSVNGLSGFAIYGVYETDDGQEHIFDTDVHKISRFKA